MTTITTWFKNYSYNDFLQDRYAFLKSKGVVLVYEKPYDNTKIYNLNDTITAKGDDYLWYYYTSLKNDNIGHQITDTEYWQKGIEIKNIFTENDFNIAKSIAENLNYFALNKNKNDIKYINLFLLCLCSYCFNFFKGYNDMIVNSASLDGMSVGGEVSGIFKEYPWLNNSIGAEYLIQRSQLIGIKDVYSASSRRITTYTTDT